jgi:hypothetical protein
MTRTDTPWRHKAVCRQDPDLWFARNDSAIAALARHVCLYHCPVVKQCNADALKTKPTEGVWGGLVWHLARNNARGEPLFRQPDPGVCDNKCWKWGQE